MSEHPFTPYVRILGKGPNLSRSLTLDETRAAVGMILAGDVEPIQLGAFLCLMRVKTETPDEVAGFALAVRATLAKPADLPAVDIDWPSYAGKSRQLPLFILSALLLAENGVSVAMHGGEGHTAGRLYTRQALADLGLAAAESWQDASRQLTARRFTYVPLEVLNRRLPEILELKHLLGLRSPLHTVVRNLNPFDAKASLMSVFHPNSRALHRDAARLMGMDTMACFKGDGGEVERRPEKPCLVEGLKSGEAFLDEWPPLLAGRPGHDLDLDPRRLGALWRGDVADLYAETTVAATAALALKLTTRAHSMDDAVQTACRMWTERRRDALAG